MPASNGLAPPQGYRLAVVGSHGGIGAALCRRAAGFGVVVAGLETDAAMAEISMPELALSLSVDVCDPASLDAAFAELGRRWTGIDGLVYVSGIGSKPQPTLSYGVDEWDRTQDVNLRGAFLAAKAAVPLLQVPTGSIVFVGSSLGVNVEPGFAAYAASKAGLIALMKTLARELAPELRVNAVAPGLVDTPFIAGGTGQPGTASNRPTLEQWFGGPERAQAMRDAIPLRRIATPADIVDPILFLLGPGAGFMTGQTLHVNGGRYLP